MGSIIAAPSPTTSRYLELHSLIGWVNGQGLRDYSGKRNHLVSTLGGQAQIDDDSFGTANWKASHALFAPFKALDTNLLDITKAGRSFVIHYAMTLVGGGAGGPAFLGKANDTSLSVSGMKIGMDTPVLDSRPRIDFRTSGGLSAYAATSVFVPGTELSLTWVRDAVANTITLWVNKAKDVTLQNLAFNLLPNTTGFFTVGGIIPTSQSGGFAGGGTATDRRVRNLQVYLSDAPLPVGITDGSLIAWLIDTRNQHLSDTQWGV